MAAHSQIQCLLACERLIDHRVKSIRFLLRWQRPAVWALQLARLPAAAG